MASGQQSDICVGLFPKLFPQTLEWLNIVKRTCTLPPKASEAIGESLCKQANLPGLVKSVMKGIY